MPEKFTSERIEELYRSGVTSPAEIARQLGTDPKYVNKVFRRKGLRGQGGASKQGTDVTQEKSEEDKEKETPQADEGSPPSDREKGTTGFEEGEVESGEERRQGTRTPAVDSWGAWYRVYVPHQTMAKFNYLKDAGRIREDYSLSDWIIDATDFTVKNKYKLQIVVEDVVEEEEGNHYEKRLAELLRNGEITPDAYFKALGKETTGGGE